MPRQDHAKVSSHHFKNSKKIILGNLRNAREHYNNDVRTVKREDRILEKIDETIVRTEDRASEKIDKTIVRTEDRMLEKIVRTEGRMLEKIDGSILKYAPKC